MGSSTPKVFLRSLLFSYFLSGFLLVATSFALYKFRLKEAQIQLMVTLIYILSGALAGFLAGKGLRRQRFFSGMLAGFLYFLILLIVSFLLGKGLHSFPQQLITIMGLCVGSGTLGGILS